MEHSDIEHMAQGYPPSHISKDHEEVVTELATQLLEVQQKLDAVVAENALMIQDYRDTPALRRMGLPLTPTTDAILNSVRAGAVEDAAKRLYGQGYNFEVLTRFAAKLRDDAAKRGSDEG